MSKEFKAEQVLETWFFESPVYENGTIAGAPPEALDLRDRLKEEWLRKYKPANGTTPCVKLTPVFRTEPAGWKVEKVEIYRMNTTLGSTPVL